MDVNYFGLIISFIECIRYSIKRNEISIYIIDFLFGMYLYNSGIYLLKELYPKNSSFTILHINLIFFTIIYAYKLLVLKYHRLRPKIFSLLEVPIEREKYFVLMNFRIQELKRKKNNDFVKLLDLFFTKKHFSKYMINKFVKDIKNESSRFEIYDLIKNKDFENEIENGFPFLKKLI